MYRQFTKRQLQTFVKTGHRNDADFFYNISRSCNAQEFLKKKKIDIAKQTATDWQSFCQEVCLDFARKNSEISGSSGQIVGIQEARIIC